MITFILKLVFVIALGVIGYNVANITLGISPVPKHLRNQISREKKETDLNETFRPIFSFAAKFVYMDPVREELQKEVLQRAGIRLSPKEVEARSILGGIFGLLICVWGYVSGSTVFALLGIVLGAALYGVSSSEATEKLKDKDKEVRKELPKFVNTIIVSMRSEKSIIKIMESYMKDANPALRSDLEVLVLQMKTGNIESALRSFDMRMGAQEITSLVTSLIYIENGVDQTAALQYLESDMRQAQAALRRAELAKLPGKMRSAFVPVGIILILMFFYTILMQTIKNFSLFI